MQAKSTLILASGSPRRKRLLAEVCSDFEVIPCPHEEPRLRSEQVTPERWALALAYFKARAVAELHPGRWVLGADTLVHCDGRILGKPRDEDDAREMLILQAEAPADVITGLCLLCHAENQQRVAAYGSTRVWMRADKDVREEYLRSGDWAGKAGAYGIQTVGDRLVDRIEGSFTNVMGLPLELLSRLLADLDGRISGVVARTESAARRTPGGAGG